MSKKISKSDEEWRQMLTPEQYEITQEKGTEPPFTGRYYSFKGKGIYKCALWQRPVQFRSEVQFWNRLAKLLGTDFGPER